MPGKQFLGPGPEEMGSPAGPVGGGRDPEAPAERVQPGVLRMGIDWAGEMEAGEGGGWRGEESTKETGKEGEEVRGVQWDS